MDRQALAVIVKNAGATLLPDNTQWIYRMEIRSQTSDKLYIVAQKRSDGSWGCSCMGWKRSRDGVRNCKHLRTMLPLLTQILPAGSIPRF